MIDTHASHRFVAKALDLSGEAGELCLGAPGDLKLRVGNRSVGVDLLLRLLVGADHLDAVDLVDLREQLGERGLNIGVSDTLRSLDHDLRVEAGLFLAHAFEKGEHIASLAIGQLHLGVEVATHDARRDSEGDEQRHPDTKDNNELMTHAPARKTRQHE